MNFLITGAGGQVGQELQKLLPQANALTHSQLDIGDISAVRCAVQTFKPNVIINAAAYTAVDNAEKEAEKADLINHIGAKNLAICSQEQNAILLHISTDYVFDGKKTEPYRETDTTNPQNVYGKSKLLGEQAILEHCEKAIILRTAWVFGRYGKNFVKTMLSLGKTRSHLRIVADQFGSPTEAEDIAKSLIYMAKNAQFGIYHYSGMPYVSWFEFAQKIFQAAHNQGILHAPQLEAITSEEYPTQACRPKNSRLNLNKINNAFGIEACDWQQHLQDLRKYL
ncbi:MAG: dTDP-4-dehydrorhamnose reductase [Neisseriaceae bacterium]|nr:dTDP-4-dehydrorhamnose reductase [Neisseriaceae bacterium]MBO7554866.1 dTDP-4-dehydrorhamnose reductase [Neisseriaceae bacterium]